MDHFAKSSDGFKIHYDVSENAPTTLLFVHGWLGNINWWDAQRDTFSDRFTVVRMDLPSHGKSEKGRTQWSSRQYAQDIKAVADQLGSQKLVLVGHSMSGAYVTEASLIIPQTQAVILVDTLKDLDQHPTHEQADAFLFQRCRTGFKSTVENVMSQFLFSPSTPLAVRQRIQTEFLSYDADLAIRILEPLYKMDVRSIAKQVSVPVRAIQSDYTPTNRDNNRKYFRDYNETVISEAGHYPMLERPEALNQKLAETLQELALL
jgi:pimeloyl-ACP methyl ester carboxylesterase